MLKICINHKSFFINNIIFLHSLLFFYFSKKKSIRQAYLCVKRYKIKIVLKLHCCNFSDWQIFAFKVLSKFKDPLGIQRFKKIKKHKNQKKNSGYISGQIKWIFMCFFFAIFIFFLLLVLLFFCIWLFFCLRYNGCTLYILLLYKRIFGKSFHSWMFIWQVL